MLAEKVYVLCKKIPKGKVTTYGELGKALNTKAYQAIGQALRKNPHAPQVPCHRVVSSTGHLHGFKGKKDASTLKEKRTLLEKEGILCEKNKINLKKYLFQFRE